MLYRERIGAVPETTPSARYQLSALLGDERRFWHLCTVVLGLFVVLKGIRMPSTWAATQAQLDYSHGFIKRGLLGEIYGAIGGQHYRTLSIAFFVELAVFLVVLVIFTRRANLEGRSGSPAILALFASSYAVTYLVHLVGYMDIPIATLAMVLLLVPSPHTRFWLGLAIVPIALLIHESFLFVFLPVVLFSFFLDWLKATELAERRRIALYAICLTILALGLTLMITLGWKGTPVQIRDLRSDIAARIDFPIRPDFFLTLSRSLGQNMRTVLTIMRTRPWWWRDFFVSILTLLPLMIFLLRYVNRLLEAASTAGAPSSHRRTVLVTRCVIAAPLLMYALGWDCARWNVLCVFSAFLVLALLSRSLPASRVLLSFAERNAVILLIAINMASGFGFMDNFNSTPYPFFPKLMQSRPTSTNLPPTGAPTN